MRENDQDRWEFEVQQYQDEQDMKAKVLEVFCWALGVAGLAVIMFLALAIDG